MTETMIAISAMRRMRFVEMIPTKMVSISALSFAFEAVSLLLKSSCSKTPSLSYIAVEVVSDHKSGILVQPENGMMISFSA